MRAPSEHGTRSRYVNGCRCEACRAANAAYVTAWRHRTGRADPTRRCWPTAPTHGTYNGYRKGCRCEACRAENAAYHRRWKAQRVAS